MVPARPKIVAHADMDAFYAAVEQLDDPSLRGKPVLIGGREGRGVVLTASYEARPFGVGSAMSMAVALRRCPQAICVPPRFERYMEISRIIMGVFADFSPTVEPLSLDEAFIEMTGAEGVFGSPRRMGQLIKDAVFEATGGLTASVGVSGTKYVAKVASDYRKPNGLTVVPPSKAREFLAPLPVSCLWGAGPVTTGRLNALGLNTIGEIARADPLWLARSLGNMGPHFQALARAEDPRRVQSRRSARSVGCERTLGKDVSDPETIALYLRRSADQIARRMRKKGIVARGVRVKLKDRSFRLHTRQLMLRVPTQVADTKAEAAVGLLSQFEHREPYRLIGMAAYDLRPERPEQLDLFVGDARRLRLERAMDAVAKRFGSKLVRRAEDLAMPHGMRMAPNLDFMDEGAG